MNNTLKSLMEAPFRVFYKAIWEIQSFALLSFRAVANIFTRPFYWKEIILQMDRMGIGSLTIVILTGFFTGAVLDVRSGACFNPNSNF